MAQASDYINLVPSENASKPNFIAVIGALIQPFVDLQNSIESIDFNINTAVGNQLDILGLWIGFGRAVKVPLNVWFSFDETGLGFDQGNWIGPYDPATGLVSMDDNTYRQMLIAKIGANMWDGTMPMFRSIMAQVFLGTGITVTPVDNQNMTMTVNFSAKPSALIMALLNGGYLPLKPEGVSQSFVFPT